MKRIGLLLVVTALFLSSCSEPRTDTPSEPGGTTARKPEVVWSAKVSEPVDYPITPTIIDDTVYARDEERVRKGRPKGHLTALDRKDGAKRWTFTSPEYGTSAPTVSGDVLFIGASNHRTYALDRETGEQIWRYRVTGETSHQPVLLGSTLLFGQTDAALQAVDSATGKDKWHFSIPYEGPAFLLTHGGRIYFGDYVGILHALDGSSGRELWTLKTDRRRSGFEPRPIVIDGTLYFASWDGSLYALDAESGRKRWTFRTIGATSPTTTTTTLRSGLHGRLPSGRPLPGSGGALTPPLAVDDTLYFISEDGNLYAIDRITGNSRWHAKAPNGLDDELEYRNGTVFTTSMHQLRAIDAKTGHLLWRYRDKVRYLYSPALTDAGVFVISTAGEPDHITNQLHLLDSSTGQERGTMTLDAKVVSRPVVVDNILYLQTDEGVVYAIK